MGFPARASAGEPASYSWHSNLHGVGFGLALLRSSRRASSSPAAPVRQRDFGWATTLCLVTALGVPAVLALSSVEFSFTARRSSAPARRPSSRGARITTLCHECDGFQTVSMRCVATRARE